MAESMETGCGAMAQASYWENHTCICLWPGCDGTDHVCMCGHAWSADG